MGAHRVFESIDATVADPADRIPDPDTLPGGARQREGPRRMRRGALAHHHATHPDPGSSIWRERCARSF